MRLACERVRLRRTPVAISVALALTSWIFAECRESPKRHAVSGPPFALAPLSPPLLQDLTEGEVAVLRMMTGSCSGASRFEFHVTGPMPVEVTGLELDCDSSASALPGCARLDAHGVRKLDRLIAHHRHGDQFPWGCTSEESLEVEWQLSGSTTMVERYTRMICSPLGPDVMAAPHLAHSLGATPISCFGTIRRDHARAQRLPLTDGWADATTQP